MQVNEIETAAKNLSRFAGMQLGPSGRPMFMPQRFQLTQRGEMPQGEPNKLKPLYTCIVIYIYIYIRMLPPKENLQRFEANGCGGFKMGRRS